MKKSLPRLLRQDIFQVVLCLLFADAANRRYMNFSELNNVGMKFEPKNQGVQYVDIQYDTNSVTFL
mgnify:FL=1